LDQDRRVGGKLRSIGQARNRAWFVMEAAVHNLIRTLLKPGEQHAQGSQRQ